MVHHLYKSMKFLFCFFEVILNFNNKKKKSNRSKLRDQEILLAKKHLVDSLNNHFFSYFPKDKHASSIAREYFTLQEVWCYRLKWDFAQGFFSFVDSSCFIA